MEKDLIKYFSLHLISLLDTPNLHFPVKIPLSHKSLLYDCYFKYITKVDTQW